MIPVPTHTYPPEGGVPDPATLVETQELTFSPLHAEASWDLPLIASVIVSVMVI